MCTFTKELKGTFSAYSELKGTFGSHNTAQLMQGTSPAAVSALS